MAQRNSGATWDSNGDTQLSSRAPLMTSDSRDTSARRSRDHEDPDEESSHLYQHPAYPDQETKESYEDQRSPTEHYSSNSFASSKYPTHNEAEIGSNQKHNRRRRHWIWYTLAAVVGAILILSLGRETSDIPIPAPWRASDKSSSALMPGVRNTFTYSNGTQYIPVPDLKIVGIVFYGRRHFVNILDCYLRRNLKINGGMLDEVQFILHTDKKPDIDWLKRLVKQDDLDNQYKLLEEDTSQKGWSRWKTYNILYRDYMSDPNTLYIKFDDDLMYIDDNAIAELIRVSLEHPEAYSVAANTVNNKWNVWMHYRTGAIWPYLAEQAEKTKWSASSWRPSDLPTYAGPIPEPNTNFTDTYTPPTEGHRWLPLEPTAHSMLRTPMGPFLPEPGNHNDSNRVGWAVAAQSHYSFFENLERGLLAQYDFGGAYDGTWNTWYTRWSINLMAIRGSHVMLKKFWEPPYSDMDRGDEYLMSLVVAKDLEMPNLVATRALAAHYSFKDDRREMLLTDILDRYRALANELVCGKGNQKSIFSGKMRPHHLVEEEPAKGDDEGEGEGDVGDGPQDVNAEDGDDGRRG